MIVEWVENWVSCPSSAPFFSLCSSLSARKPKISSKPLLFCSEGCTGAAQFVCQQVTQARPERHILTLVSHSQAGSRPAFVSFFLLSFSFAFLGLSLLCFSFAGQRGKRSLSGAASLSDRSAAKGCQAVQNSQELSMAPVHGPSQA